MPRRRSALTLIELLVVVAVIGVLIALMLPTRRGAREASRRNSCRNNLTQISIALENYAAAHGTLPPAYTVDEQGNRLHSWRTLILPHIEGQHSLYESIDLTKPWDDPVNAEARATRIGTYECPSTRYEKLGHTPYLALVGPECCFTGEAGRSLDEITDGRPNTLLVVEAPTSRSVHWMDPHDASIDDLVEFARAEDLNHPSVFLGLFADGRSQAIAQDTPPATLRAMATVAGGESIGDNQR